MTLAALALPVLLAAGQPALRDGDLVFQASRSSQSAAVALATGSPLTHVGVVLVEGGRPFVLEAVEPVQVTPFEAWRKRGTGGRVWVRRLRDPDGVLTPEAVGRLRRLGRSWVGRHYDLQFRWDDERLYCSELVHKLYDRALGLRLGRLERARDLALGSPEVQRKLRERFGARPFDPAELVVTPRSLFEDPRLVPVGQDPQDPRQPRRSRWIRPLHPRSLRVLGSRANHHGGPEPEAPAAERAP